MKIINKLTYEQMMEAAFTKEERETMYQVAKRRTEMERLKYKREIASIMAEMSDIMTKEEVNSMKHKVSLDIEERTSKPQGVEVGRIQSRIFYKSNKKELTIKRLAVEVAQKGKTIKAGHMESKEENSYTNGSLLVLDIDNGEWNEDKTLKVRSESKPYVKVEDVINRCKEIGIKPALIYETFSSNKDCISFRVIFQVDKEMDYNEAVKLYACSHTAFNGLNIDTTVGPGKLIYGGTKIVLLDDSAVINYEKIVDNYEPYKRENKAIKKASVKSIKNTFASKITKEEIITNLEAMRPGYEGIKIGYNSFEWLNENIELSEVLGVEVGKSIRCILPDHNDTNPSAIIQEFKGQQYYKCGCQELKPKSLMNTLQLLLPDMDLIEIQYLIADTLKIEIGSEYQREMRLLIADTKANITNIIPLDSVLGKAMRHLWGTLDVVQNFASAKITNKPLSKNLNRPTFFMSQRQLIEEMRRLGVKGAGNASQKLALLKDYGFIRPLKDDELTEEALEIARKEQLKHQVKRNNAHINRVEYYELCAITYNMIKTAEETITRNKELGVKKRSMNMTRRIHAHGEEFTQNVNIHNSVNSKLLHNKNQKYYDKIISKAMDLKEQQGYFTEEQLRKAFDPNRKMRKDAAQKLIDDCLPQIIKMGAKKDRVKASTREAYSIPNKIKTNTVIYC